MNLRDQSEANSHFAQVRAALPEKERGYIEMRRGSPVARADIRHLSSSSSPSLHSAAPFLVLKPV